MGAAGDGEESAGADEVDGAGADEMDVAGTAGDGKDSRLCDSANVCIPTAGGADTERSGVGSLGMPT